MGKVEMRVEIDSELFAQARAVGVDFDGAAEMGLRIALGGAGRAPPIGIVANHPGQLADPAAAEERARAWAAENAEAIRVHNARIAERGLFGEDLRRW